MNSKPLTQSEAIDIISKKKVKTQFEENELLFLDHFKKLDKKKLDKIRKELSAIKNLMKNQYQNLLI